MLGSFIRLAVFFGVVVALTWGVSRLTGMDGGVTIALAGYEHVLSPLAFAVLIIALAGALVLSVWLFDLAVTVLLFLLSDPKAVARLAGQRRQRRALDAISSGLVAIAGGDSRAAQIRLADVHRLADRPAVSRILSAMAAEAAGDRARARAHWRSLAEDPETSLAGIRGQLQLAREAGDLAQSRDLAQRAAKLRPQDAGLLRLLLDLEQETGDWPAARATLDRLRRLKALPPAEADRREATVALALAQQADAAGDMATSRDLATEAADLDPANPEAVAAAARHLTYDGETNAAAARLVAGWARAPSSALANAYAELAPDESPEARYRRFSELFAANPSHPETCYLKAELALVARQWRAARRAIEGLGEPDLSARGCAIMAAVARGEGQHEAVVRAWLARALTAPREEGPGRDVGHAAMLPLLVEDDPEDGSGDASLHPSGSTRAKDMEAYQEDRAR